MRDHDCRLAYWLIVLLALGWVSCADAPAPVPISQRLVDVFEPGWIEGSLEEPVTPPRPSEWRFDGLPPYPRPEVWPETHGWEPISGIEELRLERGRLTGVTSAEPSILRLDRVSGLGDGDLLHEVRVRLKASAGTQISLHLVGSEADELDRAIAAGQEALWMLNAPLVAGDEAETYILKSPFPRRSSDIHRIFLRPSDLAGAKFEIESIRLVFNREYLAELPSGVGWQGLSDIYRETVLLRVPETIQWAMTLPRRPRLELALGTLDQQPVTFRLSLDPGDGVLIPLLQRTLTTPTRWETVAMDLDEYESQNISLHLALESRTSGAVGLLGSPVVRERITPSVPTAAEASGRTEPPQGVIFILVDTLRPDRLDAYGHQRSTMPVVTQLAQEGVLFRNAVAQGTWTKTSTASLFTSLYPSTSGVLDFADRVPSSATTLAEAYRQAGYATLGFSSVLFTGKYSNLHQGYEELHETMGQAALKTARGFVDRLLPWLEAHQQERFFVLLHVFDPHSPFESEAASSASWVDPDWRQEHKRDKRHLESFISDPWRRIIEMPTRDEVLQAGFDPEIYIERELAWYDGLIRSTDQEIGRLIERLQELGLDKKTLIVFTSDHGEEFHEHGQMTHGHSVYGELARVPMVLWYPSAVQSGLVVDETVQLIDVMPTLLELSDLPLPSEIQGQSLMPLMATTGVPGDGSSSDSLWRPRPAISQRPYTPRPYDPPLPAAESTALIFEGWKLIHNLEPIGNTPEFELFDYKKDPLDQMDLAAEHPEVVERMAELLSAWRLKATAERLSSDEAIQETLPQEELERLRALGYVQ